MVRFIKGDTSKKIFKNSIYLTVGSIGSKLIGLFVYIYIARMLGPSGYGDLQTVIRYVGLFAIITSFGLDMLALREGSRDREHIHRIQNEYFPLRFHLSILAVVLAVAIAFVLPYPFEIKFFITIASLLLLVGGAIPAGLSNHFDTTFRIVERMEYVSIIQIARIIFFAGLVGIGLHFYPEVITILVILIISSILGLILRYHYSKQFVHYSFSPKIDREKTISTMKIAAWFGIGTLLFRIYTKVDVQMIYLLSGSEEVGFYSAAWQIVEGGTIFLTALSLSIFPTSSRKILTPGYSQKLMKVVGLLVAITGAFSAGIAYFSDRIVDILFGSEYESSGIILSILIWFIPLRFVMLWGNQILETTNALKTRISGYVIPAIINIILNAILIPMHGAVGAAMASIAATLVMCIMISYLGRNVLKKVMNNPEKAMGAVW